MMINVTRVIGSTNSDVPSTSELDEQLGRSFEILKTIKDRVSTALEKGHSSPTDLYTFASIMHHIVDSESELVSIINQQTLDLRSHADFIKPTVAACDVKDTKKETHRKETPSTVQG